MNDPRRGNEEEREQNQQDAPQGRGPQGGYSREDNEESDELGKEEQSDDRYQSGSRAENNSGQQEEDQDDTEAYDEQEGEEGDEDEPHWVDRATEIVTGQAEDAVYEKLIKYASIAIVGFWGLRRGGLLGGIVASAALGLAAKSLGGEQEEMSEDEQEAEAA